jgi:hypothetical protein
MIVRPRPRLSVGLAVILAVKVTEAAIVKAAHVFWQVVMSQDDHVS